jgi:hypothetical protein
MRKRYTLADKQNAIQYIDDHPDVPIYEVAKRLKIEKNTLYIWNSKGGRTAIRDAIHTDTVSHLSAAAAEKLDDVVLSSPPADVNTAWRIKTLEKELASLRELTGVYRKMLGLP